MFAGVAVSTLKTRPVQFELPTAVTVRTVVPLACACVSGAVSVTVPTVVSTAPAANESPISVVNVNELRTRMRAATE